MSVRSAPPFPVIVGAGRSGTTLLRLMLDAHPALAIPPETHFLPRIVQSCAESSDPREGFLWAITTHRTWPDMGLDAAALRQSVAPMDPFDAAEATRRFYRLYAERLGKHRAGDKTPDYIRCMPLIQHLIPEARFIHLIRDGRDVALSINRLWFGPESIEEAATWWAALIRRARRDAESIDHYLEVRYEDLVREPERTLRQVCAFIALDFDACMLAYHTRSAKRLSEMRGEGVGQRGRAVPPAQRREVHALTQEPPRHDRIGRWRRQMTPLDRLQFERIAGGLLAALRYETSPGFDPRQADPALWWTRRLNRALDTLRLIIAPGQTLVLAADGSWPSVDLRDGRTPLPFRERDGVFWGPPVDDDDALSELRRQRERGAQWFVLAWPAFWYLDHYTALRGHLDRCYCCVHRDADVIIYSLASDAAGAGAGASPSA